MGSTKASKHETWGKKKNKNQKSKSDPKIQTHCKIISYRLNRFENENSVHPLDWEIHKAPNIQFYPKDQHYLLVYLQNFDCFFQATKSTDCKDDYIHSIVFSSFSPFDHHITTKKFLHVVWNNPHNP